MKKGIQNTNKRGGMFNGIYSCSIVLLFMCSFGCSKSEDAIEQERFTLLQLNTITVDSMRLSVTDSDKLLTDSLMTPEGKVSMTVKYDNPLRRYKVTDLYSNALLFDSTIHYQQIYNNSVTFFQPASGEKIILVSPPVNEQKPHKDSAKLSVVYSIPSTDAIYDQIKVVVEQSKDGGTAYIPMDSFLLKRGEFSPYITSLKQRRPILKFYTTNASRVQVGTTYSGFFSLAGDISIYYLNLKSNTNTSGIKLY